MFIPKHILRTICTDANRKRNKATPGLHFTIEQTNMSLALSGDKNNLDLRKL